jgi:uncharacterized membrane protein YecN with MAPEG domain
MRRVTLAQIATARVLHLDAFTQAIIRWQAHGGAATAPALAVSQQTIQEMFG